MEILALSDDKQSMLIKRYPYS